VHASGSKCLAGFKLTAACAAACVAVELTQHVDARIPAWRAQRLSGVCQVSSAEGKYVRVRTMSCRSLSCLPSQLVMPAMQCAVCAAPGCDPRASFCLQAVS